MSSGGSTSDPAPADPGRPTVRPATSSAAATDPPAKPGAIRRAWRSQRHWRNGLSAQIDDLWQRATTRRIRSKLLDRTWEVNMIVRASIITLMPDALVTLLVFWLTLRGTNGHIVIFVGSAGYLLVRLSRQIRESRYIPQNWRQKTGTVAFVILLCVVNYLTFGIRPGFSLGLLSLLLATAYLAWLALLWFADMTLIGERHVTRITNVMTDDTPNHKIAGYGPVGVHRSVLSKSATLAATIINWIGRKVFKRNPNLVWGWGDVRMDGPSQDDAVVGWLKAVPRPYEVMAALTAVVPPSESAAAARDVPHDPYRLDLNKPGHRAKRRQNRVAPGGWDYTPRPPEPRESPESKALRQFPWGAGGAD